MAGSAQTILISPADGFQRVEEALGTGVITAGHLLARDATGVVVHGTAQGASDRIFAEANLPVGGTIDTDYAAGDTVRFLKAQKGDVINALVIDGTAAIALNAVVSSDGAGGMVTAVAGLAIDAGIVGRALEAVDNSGGSAPVRIKVEIM